MAQSYFDRYGDFKKNGKMRFIPFIKLTKKNGYFIFTNILIFHIKLNYTGNIRNL